MLALEWYKFFLHIVKKLFYNFLTFIKVQLSNDHQYKIRPLFKQQLIAQSKNVNKKSTQLYRELFKNEFKDDGELGNHNAESIIDKYKDTYNSFYG